MIPVVIYPTQVQGEAATAQIVRAIEVANARDEVDVLIVGRGGGSLEDLWCFNEEAVARAIAGSAIPVVSGVGHETDFSIADFVADLRAPTPTAAAVAVSPDREALAAELDRTWRRLTRDARRAVEYRAQRLDAVARRLLTPTERLARNRERLAQLARRLSRDAHVALERRQSRLASLRTALAHLDPTQVLSRGYSIVRDGSGHVRHSVAGLAPGDALDVTFADGTASTEVKRIR